MAELSAELKAQIDAAFDEAGIKGSHGDCVDACRLDYDLCMAGGFSGCRDKLESCINGCPDGFAPDKLKALLDRLEQIEALAR